MTDTSGHWTVIVVMVTCALVGTIFLVPSNPGAVQPIPYSVMATMRMRMVNNRTFPLSIERNEDLRFILPGDPGLDSRPVRTLSEYLQRLGRESDLNPEEAKSLYAPFRGEKGWFSPSPRVRECPFKVYRVKQSDPDDTVFLATRNFIYGQSLDEAKAPRMNGFFIVIQKGGTERALSAKEVSDFATIGRLPGRKNLNDRPFETEEDLLSQE